MELPFSKRFRGCHPAGVTAVSCGPHKKGLTSVGLLPPRRGEKGHRVRRCPGDQAAAAAAPWGPSGRTGQLFPEQDPQVPGLSQSPVPTRGSAQVLNVSPCVLTAQGNFSIHAPGRDGVKLPAQPTSRSPRVSLAPSGAVGCSAALPFPMLTVTLVLQEQFPLKQEKSYPGWVWAICALLSLFPALWVPGVALTQLLARRQRKEDSSRTRP